MLNFLYGTAWKEDATQKCVSAALAAGLPYDPKASIQSQVRQSFESSLEHLHTDYIDSLVLHGPSVFNSQSLSAQDWEAWES
jgi:aryl-alcohol dehydrogenase-like predicted oxidoreductase